MCLFYIQCQCREYFESDTLHRLHNQFSFTTLCRMALPIVCRACFAERLSFPLRRVLIYSHKHTLLRLCIRIGIGYSTWFCRLYWYSMQTLVWLVCVMLLLMMLCTAIADIFHSYQVQQADRASGYSSHDVTSISPNFHSNVMCCIVCGRESVPFYFYFGTSYYSLSFATWTGNVICWKIENWGEFHWFGNATTLSRCFGFL